MFRASQGRIEVLLAHPGGPYWAKTDAGVWSIPKGEPAEGEELQAAALREFEEETGSAVNGELIPLESCRQKGGKVVTAWAVRGDFDLAGLRSNTFSMEWPPRSGKHRDFPEVDRAQWFSIAEAREKILDGQAPFLDRLIQAITQKSPAV